MAIVQWVRLAIALGLLVLGIFAVVRVPHGALWKPAVAVYDAGSPIRFVGPESPPTLLIHGTRDELVFAEQSRRLDAVLADAGVPHLLVELPWGTHGTDANPSGPGGQLATWLADRFLQAVDRPAADRPAVDRPAVNRPAVNRP